MIETLRKLCAEYWNPIGVMMEFEEGAASDPSPMPADEYDGYLYEIWKMAKAGSTEAEMIAYLGKVESDYMGITKPSGDKASFVSQLAKLLSESSA